MIPGGYRGGDRHRKVLRANLDDILLLDYYLNSTGGPRIGLCIDVAQLFTLYGNSGTAEFLKQLKSACLPVKEFHVSDVLSTEVTTHRVAMEVGSGNINWKLILPLILENCNNLLIETLGGVKVFQRSKMFLESLMGEK
jgi:hypothetical protein